MTGNKEISKWTGREWKYHANFTSREARNRDWLFEKGIDYYNLISEFELEWQKSKDKELTRLFWNKLNVSDFSTLFLISNLSDASNMVWVIEG